MRCGEWPDDAGFRPGPGRTAVCGVGERENPGRSALLADVARFSAAEVIVEVLP